MVVREQSKRAAARLTFQRVTKSASIKRCRSWGAACLQFTDGDGGASSIRVQPLDGGPPRKLTSFTEGRMTTFDWSHDGQRLAGTRINELSDVVAVPLDATGQHD